MKRLAVLFSSSDAGSWLQLVTLLMAAVHEEKRVSVLFRGESVYCLRPGHLERLQFSGLYAGDAEFPKRLEKLGLSDIDRMMGDIKASGEVEYYACSSSMALAGLEQSQLFGWVGAVIGMPAFLSDEMGEADQVLTF